MKPYSKSEKMLVVAVLTLFMNCVSAYSQCSPSDVKGPIIIPIDKVLSTTPIVISGNIQIIDGCTVS